MEDKKEIQKEDSGRRNFLKMGFWTGGAAAMSVIGFNALADDEKASGEKVKVLTADGKSVTVDSNTLENSAKCATVPANGLTRAEAREGIPNKKFVMVVDLAKCKNALKCQDSCNKNHYITGKNAWIKVYKMQESQDTAPYWMPMTCQHCDQPACVTVCPVDATFKRRDGLVLIDNEQCIGCRFCMAACPYSARVFNWSEPNQETPEVDAKLTPEHSVEHTGHNSLMGTVDKCDFCPHSIRQGEVPHCVSSCPNDVFLFGDVYEDTVTNGSGKSYRLSQLLEDKAGYRYMDELGTQPSVFYLPPVDRTDNFEAGLDDYNEFESVAKP
jgi:Fe-S-cluster-containing dehydrogenase component